VGVQTVREVASETADTVVDGDASATAGASVRSEDSWRGIVH
jgi:hypothetical protein